MAKAGKAGESSAPSVGLPPQHPGSAGDVTERVLVGGLVPLLGRKGAQLTLTINGALTGDRTKQLQDFVRESGARAKIDLTVDLADKTADFQTLVTKFLDSQHDELVKLAFCASSGSPPGPGHKPPPRKPVRPPPKPGEEPPKTPPKRKPA